MPPYVPRKKARSPSPRPEPSPAPAQTKSNGEKKTKVIPPRKQTIHDALDARSGSVEKTKRFLESLRKDDDDDEDSELSVLSSDELEGMAPSSSKLVKSENDRIAIKPKPAPKAKKEVKPKSENSEKKKKKRKTTLLDTAEARYNDRAEAEAKSSPVISVPISRKAPPRKRTLHDDLDNHGRDPNRVKKFLNNLAANYEGEDSDLETTDSDEVFEDVVSNENAGKRRKVEKGPESRSEEGSEDEEDEDMEFEDVEPSATPGLGLNDVQTRAGPSVYRPRPGGDEEESDGDLDLTLTRDTRIPLVNTSGTKKGPSKIERAIRVATHQMHVQFLLWHNAIRNGWCSDEEVQEVLARQLLKVKGMDKVIERWRRDSGLAEEDEEKPKESMRTPSKPAKAKGKEVSPERERSQREWGSPAKKATPGKVNVSNGDPLIALLTRLATYWRSKFTITAPGLHKIGYMTLQRIDEMIKSNRVDEEYDVKRHGERIPDKAAWKKAAEELEGSRDVGAQLFAALLRSLGLQVRIVTSLQPAGFGWSKNEEAAELKEKKEKRKEEETPETSSENSDAATPARRKHATKSKSVTPGRKSATQKSKTPLSKRPAITKDTPIDMDTDEADAAKDESSDDFVVEMPKAKKKSKNYEKGLAPNYWVEVFSHITNTWHSCSPFFATDPVSTCPELLARFEPRGAKANKAKQVFCYVIAYSADGTAKDVTVRYLKRHMFPGVTKGVRMMPEKVPVYDRHGRVKRYENYDWFKSVMSGYERPGNKRTPADDVEDETDLKPVKPEQKEKKKGEETLQDYKGSKEFVLERHLRREEALLPTAKPVKKFLVKGKRGEESVEEDVFLRKDVVHCKSVETWHKEGRRPKIGEQPRKRVPFRAATINRKRELAEAELASGGQKMLQGLYSFDQTEWIIPDPIVDGRIPKNGYGNMDCYVESMVPKGAVHLRLKGAKRICNKLGIDFAEAVTGFEFGARMAIPVIEGVVVAEENAELVRNAWQEYEKERVRKEDEKRRRAALGMWRKMMMGLRIIKRIKEEYPEDAANDQEMLNDWGQGRGGDNSGLGDDDAARAAMDVHEEEMAGGFFPEGFEEEEVPEGTFFPTRHDTTDEDGGAFMVEDGEKEKAPQTFFPTRHDSDDEDAGGGFVIEDTPATARASASATSIYPTPMSRPNASTQEAAEMDMEDVKLADELAEEPIEEPKKLKASVLASVHKTPPKPRAKAAFTPRSAAAKKRPQVESSDDDVEMADAPASAPSSAQPEDQNDNEEEEEKKPKARTPAKRGRLKRADVPKESPATRQMPKRRATRKSTGTKSQYFVGDSEDEE